MYYIAIIGVGQLGSRHLQGLKKVSMEIEIYVVDPNQNNLNIARERYTQIPNNPLIQSVSYLSDISLLPQSLDVVIIATGSKPRSKIIQTLLADKEIKYLILEKFLFPSLNEYKKIADLLEYKQIKAWVNCPRRMYPFYKELKTVLADYTYLKYSVTGINWGLACNSIHFLDLFAMFSGYNEFTVDLLLDSKIIESKRDGYIEFSGTIRGDFNNSKFTITSNHGNEIYYAIEIETDKYLIKINEFIDNLEIEYLETKEIITKQIHVPYQSDLTNIAIEQILKTGKSDLTEYKISAQLHLQFLSPIVNFYNNITGNTDDSCPIT